MKENPEVESLLSELQSLRDRNERLVKVVEKMCEAITSYKVQKQDNPRNKKNGLLQAWNKIAVATWDAYKALSDNETKLSKETKTP